MCLPLEGMDPETYERYMQLQNDLKTVTRLWSDARTDRDTAQSMIRVYDELLGNEQKKALDELSLDQALTELEKAHDGCVAPSDGVITTCFVDDGAYLFIVDDEKRVRKKYVSTGAKDSSYTQILSGISGNEMIVNDLSAAEFEDEKISPVPASEG